MFANPSNVRIFKCIVTFWNNKWYSQLKNICHESTYVHWPTALVCRWDFFFFFRKSFAFNFVQTIATTSTAAVVAAAIVAMMPLYLCVITTKNTHFAKIQPWTYCRMPNNFHRCIFNIYYIFISFVILMSGDSERKWVQAQGFLSQNRFFFLLRSIDITVSIKSKYYLFT